MRTAALILWPVLISAAAISAAAESLPDGDVQDLVASGSATNQTLVALWEDDPYANCGPDAVPAADMSDLARLRFSAPRGARAITSFRLTNRTDQPALYNLSVSSTNTSDFAAAVRIRRAEYLELNNGTMTPDIIVDLPLGSLLSVPARSTAVVWIDVDVSGLPSGTSRADVILKSAYAAHPDKWLDLQLYVNDIDIRDIDLPLWTYMIRTPEDIRLMRDYPFNTACILPAWYCPDPMGDGTRDFSKIDEIMAAFAANGIPQNEVRFMLYAMFPTWCGSDYRTPAWEDRYAANTRAFITYVKEKYGVGYDRLMFAVNDEPNGDPDDEKSSAFHAFYGAQFAKKIDPQLKSFANPWKGDSDPWLDRYLTTFDILEPFLRVMFDGKAPAGTPARYVASGKEIWSYTIFIKENTPHQYRRIWWTHLDFGFDGPATIYDLWDTSGDPFNSHDGKPGHVADYNAAYYSAGRKRATPSRRLESWYRGMVDFKTAKWIRRRLARANADGAVTAGYERALKDLAAAANTPSGRLDRCSVQLQVLAKKVKDASFVAGRFNSLAPHSRFEHRGFWDTFGYVQARPIQAFSEATLVQLLFRTRAASESTEVVRQAPDRQGLVLMVSRNDNRSVRDGSIPR